MYRFNRSLSKLQRLGTVFCCSMAALVWLSSCSSAPRELSTTRQAAESYLALANQEADMGNYDTALALAEEARRMARNADYAPLFIRAELSRGNILFYLGEESAAQEAWEGALADAGAEKEVELEALCRIYLARGRLLGAMRNAQGQEEAAREAISAVNRAIGAIKQDKMAIALGRTVLALAEKELGRWQEAESQLRNALAVYVADSRWAQAGYAWYLIASVRSMAGQYSQAIAALEEALRFDRRTENAYSIGKDWQAMGDVYAKWGRAAEAAQARRRAEEIYQALGRE